MEIVHNSLKVAFALLALGIEVTPSFADEVRIVAIAGDQVPGGDGNSPILNRFSGFSNSSIPLISDSGHILITAELLAGTNGVTNVNKAGIWRVAPDGTTSLVARTGTGAWAPSGSLSFSALSTPLISSNGDVVFKGTLAGSGVTTANATSYWRFNGSSRDLLVREGESAPSVLGATLGTISDIALSQAPNNETNVVFQSLLAGTGFVSSNNKSIWVDGIGQNNSTPLVRQQAAIAEFPSLTCKNPARSTSSIGESVLYCSLTGAGIVEASTDGTPRLVNDQVIWMPGSSTYIARAGDLAPDTSNDLRFGRIFSSDARRQVINSRGHVAFAPALVDSSGVQIASSIYSNRSGSLRLIAKTGDQAPGFPAGVVYSTLPGSVTISSFPYALADNDALIFTASLTGPGVTFGSDRAIFRSNPDGSTELLVQGGVQVEGASPGTVISNNAIARTWRVNGSGEIAFIATLAGPEINDGNDVAMFVTANGQRRMVAREGDPIPGADGWRFSAAYAEPLIYFNARGQMLFPCGASGGPAGAGSTSGWFRVDETMVVRPLRLGGEIITGNSGPALRLTSSLPTSPMSFSDRGEVVFLSDLMPGSTENGQNIYGQAIVSVKIQPAGTVPPSCPADFNSDGTATVQDIFDFLTALFAHDLRADFTHDGSVAVQDLFEFLNVWFEGC